MRRRKASYAFALAVLLVCLVTQASAGVIGSWDFDAQALTPTQGDGSQLLIGGVAATVATWVSGYAASSYTSWGYETDNYPAQNTASGTAGMRFAIPTGGYTGITVSFDKLHGATASRYVRFQFSTNGGQTWSDAATGSLMQETTTNWTNWSFDLSSFPAVDNNPNFQFRMVTVFDPGSNPGAYTATQGGQTYSPQGTIAWDNVVVTGTRCLLNNFVEDVPDVNQPCANPMGLVGFINTNYCGPTSALNICDYWDVVAGSASAAYVDGNPNPGPTSALQFIGWWMNTNDDPAMAGCPYRVNGNPSSMAGTVMDDIASGLIQYARWDSSHDFGCSPPTLLVGKNGYDWSAVLTRPGTAGWNTIKSEIDATPGRPLIVCWEYWNPSNGFYDSSDGITYYDWGQKVSGSTDQSHSESWNLAMDIGHATTAVGYKANYAPGGQGTPKDWVIVHDNWHSTAREVAVPWQFLDPQTQQMKTYCTGMITVDPATAPTVGALTGAAGASNPPNQGGIVGSAVVAAQLSFTASATENVLLNAFKLQASGSGNDATEITSIDIVRDKDSNGIPDTTKGDTILVTHNSGFPQDNGTLTIVIPGNWLGQVKASATADILIVYHFRSNAGLNKTFGFTLQQVYATGQTTYLDVPVNDSAVPPNPFTFTSSTITTCDVPVIPIDPDTGDLKRYGDGWMLLANMPLLVIHSEPSSFYVEQQNRCAGIKLVFEGVPPPPVNHGDGLFFEGRLQTVDFERCLLVTSPATPAQAGPEKPLGMLTRSVGGGDSAWEGVTHAGQKGVAGGVGANNIGLLVRCAGRFMYGSESMFMLDDASGLPLKCVVSPGVTLNPIWTHALVTGVSSTELTGDVLLPVLRVRDQNDIVGF